MKPPSRALTTLAVGVLSLDALLLVYGGVELRRPILIGVGVLCALVVLLVLIGWRRYRRTLTELDSARRELRAEVESIRELLQSKHLQN